VALIYITLVAIATLIMRFVERKLQTPAWNWKWSGTEPVAHPR
jgi:peptidoglycan/LPS O-acetylase OafA/YrhL